jgi:hypothetical protein
MGFKDVENRDPILAGRLHADFGATILQEPIPAGLEIRIKGGELFLFVRSNPFKISGGDTDGDKFLMNVDTGTMVVNNTQHKSLLSK